MIWTVKRIQEDDYGCEERTEDAKATVDEGDRWPSGISTSKWMC